MPVFRSGAGNAPTWGVLDDFEFIAFKPGEVVELERKEAKEAFVLCRGHISARAGGTDCSLTPRSWFAVDNSGSEAVSLRANYFDALVMRATGRWTSITSAGLFDVWTTSPPTQFHEEAVDVALAHDMDILLEKPIAHTMEACCRIQQKVKRAGRKMLVVMSRFLSRSSGWIPGSPRCSSIGSTAERLLPVTWMTISNVPPCCYAAIESAHTGAIVDVQAFLQKHMEQAATA